MFRHIRRRGALTDWHFPDPWQSQKAASLWPHHMSAQTSQLQTCPIVFSLLKLSSALSHLQVGAPLCAVEHSRQSCRCLPALPTIPVPLNSSQLLGLLMGHGRCAWASKPVWNKVSSLKTVRENSFFSFF